MYRMEFYYQVSHISPLVDVTVGMENGAYPYQALSGLELGLWGVRRYFPPLHEALRTLVRPLLQRNELCTGENHGLLKLRNSAVCIHQRLRSQL